MNFIRQYAGFTCSAILVAAIVVSGEVTKEPMIRRYSVPVCLDGAEVRSFRGFNWSSGLYGDVMAKHPELIPVSYALLTSGLHGDGWVVEFMASNTASRAYAVICRHSRESQEASIDDLLSSHELTTEHSRAAPPACNITHVDLYGWNVESHAALSRMISLPSLRVVALPFVLRFEPDWKSLPLAEGVRELIVYNQTLTGEFVHWIGQHKNLDTLVLVNCMLHGSLTSTTIKRLILVGATIPDSARELAAMFPGLISLEALWSVSVLEEPDVMAQFPRLKTAVFDHVLVGASSLWRYARQSKPVTNSAGERISITVRGELSSDGPRGPSMDASRRKGAKSI